MEYKVVEVNSGMCTGTMRGNAIQAVINQYAKAGWKFEGWSNIIGRSCCQPEYKFVVCFSRETDEEDGSDEDSEVALEPVTINGKDFVKKEGSEEILCPECNEPIENPETIKFCGSCGHKYE